VLLQGTEKNFRFAACKTRNGSKCPDSELINKDFQFRRIRLEIWVLMDMVIYHGLPWQGISVTGINKKE
jgi:hypothetical protein